MDELQAGVEQPLAVLPQSAVLFQPRKAAFDNPALRHGLESVQLTALGHLYRHVFAQDVSHALCERLAAVGAVAQHALHPAQGGLAPPERAQRSFAIGHFDRSHRHCVRQPLRSNINSNVGIQHVLEHAKNLPAPAAWVDCELA